jgi:hypothetical protein
VFFNKAFCFLTFNGYLIAFIGVKMAFLLGNGDSSQPWLHIRTLEQLLEIMGS